MDEIEKMRIGGRMLATVLASLKTRLEVGMSTKDLADIASRELKSLGGKPAFLGYQGFPDVLCVSLNNEVVHGIPSRSRIIEDGDIVSMDFGVLYGGLITDAAISVIAGQLADSEATRLVSFTERALMNGIDVVKRDVHVGTIAHNIQSALDEQNFGIVRDLVGHGVGHELHEEPNIPNYGQRGTGIRLQSGMTIAIEPMATLGGYKVKIAPDGWTVLTADDSWSAHFEHTVLITDTGPEILTLI